MDRKTLAALGLVSAALAAAPGRATAQGFGTFGRPPVGRPAVSPFLNLFRGGNPAINYYGLVRPEIDTRNSLLQLQQQSVQGAIPLGIVGQPTDRTLQGPPSTGHPVRFGNYGRYFANLGSGQAVIPPVFAPRSLLVPNSPFFGTGVGTGFGFGGIGYGGTGFGFGGIGNTGPSIEGVFVR
jgi:hypothetical protein